MGVRVANTAPVSPSPWGMILNLPSRSASVGSTDTVPSMRSIALAGSSTHTWLARAASSRTAASATAPKTSRLEAAPVMRRVSALSVVSFSARSEARR